VAAIADRLVDAVAGQIRKTPRDIRASFSGVMVDAFYAIVEDVRAVGLGAEKLLVSISSIALASSIH